MTHEAVGAMTAKALVAEATAIIDRAEIQHRDLSEFEAGRVDALLEVAGRVSRTLSVRVGSAGSWRIAPIGSAV